MVRDSARFSLKTLGCSVPPGNSARTLIFARLFFAALFLTVLLAPVAHGLEIKLPKPPVVDKPTRPEHNVSLMIEQRATDLLNRAAKARARAEKEPEEWPNCFKFYAEILKKYPNAVYLDHWEGMDKEPLLSHYRNGLYKAMRERVAEEIASLPPEALTVYQAINDQAARSLYYEGSDQFDERKMERLARDFVLTQWSNDALAWLGEFSFENGAWRESAEYLQKAAASPGKTATNISALARLFLAQAKMGDKPGAGKTLAAIEAALNDPANTANKGTLRIGHDEGPAALANLKTRLERITAVVETAGDGVAENEWPTYFGNATHTLGAQPRSTRGLRKWSVRINDLLYGKNTVSGDTDTFTREDAPAGLNTSINQQLTIKDGFFYINDGHVYSAYPLGAPVPGSPRDSQGNAKFQLPLENVRKPPVAVATPRVNRNGEQIIPTGIAQHPYFATLAGSRAFGVLGEEAFASGAAARGRRNPFNNGGDDDRPKGPSNYPVAFGRAENGRETVMLWSLKPGEPAFASQSKEDQEWLKSAYFTSSPTYDSGVLYSMAVVIPPSEIIGASVDAFAVALDAETGRMLWHTQICSAAPIYYGGDVQPDRGLPVAVADHTVFVVTNLGAVAALNAGSGAVKWIRVYDRSKTSVDQQRNVGEVVQSHEFWAPNPPMVYRNRLIVTPQDSDTIYVYDVATGSRRWEESRFGRRQDAKEAAAPGVPAAPLPQTRYKHVLGISDGALVLSGTHLLLIDLMTGKYLADPLPIEGVAKGRGAVAGHSVWISTDKHLCLFEIENKAGAWKLLERQPLVWTNPKEEAGSVYAVGGVLYTVSHSHVNSYIIWQELEEKLLDRLKAKPGDFAARIELAGLYANIDRFDQALGELEKARAAAASAAPDERAKVDEALLAIGTRKFEALMALGEQARKASKPDEAAERIKQAYAAATVPGMSDMLPVLALKAEADLYTETGNLSAAAAAYQLMIAKHGNVVFQDMPKSTKMARLYAQMNLTALKAKDPKSFAAIDAEAKAALEGAGSDARKLADVIAKFPNSDHSGTALLALARIDLEKTPDRARLNASRFLYRYHGGPGTPLALAIVAVSCERMELLAPAQEALTRLASSEEFKDAKISLEGVDPDAAKGDVPAAQWAAKRLEDKKYRHAPSQSIFSMGEGKLSREPVWRKPAEKSTIPLIPDGIPPVEMRRAVFYLENQTEISAVSGRDGTDLWKPRPAAPVNSHGRAFWWERLLIVCGKDSIIAYDSAENGKVAWSQDLKLEAAGESGYWAQISGDRLILAHTGNILEAFDLASGGKVTGGPLWRTPLTGSQMTFAPVCGDGFLIVTTANSNMLSAYNLETGGQMWSVPVTELVAPPVVSGDKVIMALRTLKLSVLDGKTGKPASPDIAMESQATGLRASGNLAVVSLGGRDLVVYRIDAKTPTPPWRVILPVGCTVNDFFIDGDDLLVSSMVVQTQAKFELSAYSLRSQGKIKWRQPMATDAASQIKENLRINGGRINGNVRRINGGVRFNDDGSENFVYPDGSNGWPRENVAREGLVMLQANWDISGANSKVAAMIDRTTGKSVWDAALKTEPSPDGTVQPARIQFFEGGLVLTDANVRTAYCAPRPGGGADELKELAERAAKDPGDIAAHIRLATATYDSGDREKALASLSALLVNANLSDSDFTGLYTQFASLRKDFAARQHATLVFQRVDKAPDLAGGNAGWDAVQEKVLDSWLNVYLASEDSSSRTVSKKGVWRGADDLKATFKGAYDDKNLYIQIVVKDDIHKNEQAEGGRIDFGDALTLAFDMGLTGSVSGYSGETFELALGLAKNGKASGWRRHEHGRYLRGQTPLENGFSVTRREPDRTTVYQLALPLDYLGVKPEPGKKFGFTFAVQDQDAGATVEKSICPSPGLIGTRRPNCFSQGVLEAKK